MKSTVPSLADPLRVGELTLPNRVIMAPLTRCRAGEGRVPTALAATYYAQRASAGLILTEATAVSPQGVGYPDTPGVWSAAQIEGWKQTTEAVHRRGGRIFLQLWHVGRISDPHYLNGETPVGPSAIAPAGHVSGIRPTKPFVTPRALEADEILAIVEDFRRGAANAKEAGFDGVEIHGANGYLVDQFLQDGTNRRTDEWGGSVENRARFLLAVTDAAISVWGAGRVGVHLAPRGGFNDIQDSDPAKLFGYVARELRSRQVAFIFVRETLAEPRVAPLIKAEFGGPFILNEEIELSAAPTLLRDGDADAVSWGRLFIANPDLPERIAAGAPLNEPNPETFYGGTEVGYTDYPTLAEAASAS